MARSADTVLVGTTKGAFLLSNDAGEWAVRGPFCGGWPINHVVGDAATGQFWAGGGNDWTGAGIWHSADGESWTLVKLSNGKFDDWLIAEPDFAAQMNLRPDPPAPFTGAVESVWSLQQTNGRLLAGMKPAALYESRDAGASWQKIDGLTDHPSAPDWQPGGAGLVLHTIVSDRNDPGRIWVGISAAGVFATEDGGANWDRRNRLSNEGADHAHAHPGNAAHDHETGHCVHNMVLAPGTTDRLYQQNHHGVFRSADGGRSWHEISGGLPTNYGFPIAVHPHDPDTLWVLPLNGDMAGRFPPDAAAAVWRSRDGGESWQALREGLPQKGCFFTVLRQAMATRDGASVGLAFGTNSGSVFFSADEGDSWSEIARHLPTVLSVEFLAKP